MFILGKIAKASRIRKMIPEPVKRVFRKWILTDEYVRMVSYFEDPNANAEEISTYPAKVDVRLGIIKEFRHLHSPYIDACRELGVPYRLIDISGPDWLNNVKNSGCDAFLVRPSAHITIWKQMFDERLKVITGELNKVIYPGYDEIWFYESKRRMHYWLESNNVPHPKTWVFYDTNKALEFANKTTLPIIYKVDLGSAASGVEIFRDRSKLKKHIKKCFNKGFIRDSSDKRDKQWGSVLFQEYLPDIKEWRVARLGDGFYGHQKLKAGDYHSGSHLVGWYNPPQELLEFVYQITQKGGFTCMDIDVFETPDGKYYVNELQCVFGAIAPYQMLVDGVPGRYLRVDGKWKFEEGVFCQDKSYRERVVSLVKSLGFEVPRVGRYDYSVLDPADVENSKLSK